MMTPGCKAWVAPPPLEPVVTQLPLDDMVLVRRDTLMAAAYVVHRANGTLTISVVGTLEKLREAANQPAHVGGTTPAPAPKKKITDWLD